jgi:hypothetical protein
VAVYVDNESIPARVANGRDHGLQFARVWNAQRHAAAAEQQPGPGDGAHQSGSEPLPEPGDGAEREATS